MADQAFLTLRNEQTGSSSEDKLATLFTSNIWPKTAWGPGSREDVVSLSSWGLQSVAEEEQHSRDQV